MKRLHAMTKESMTPKAHSQTYVYKLIGNYFIANIHICRGFFLIMEKEMQKGN